MVSVVNPFPGGVENIRFLVGGGFQSPPYVLLEIDLFGPKK